MLTISEVIAGVTMRLELEDLSRTLQSSSTVALISDDKLKPRLLSLSHRLLESLPVKVLLQCGSMNFLPVVD